VVSDCEARLGDAGVAAVLAVVREHIAAPREEEEEAAEVEEGA
jgi:hypothetical protein